MLVSACHLLSSDDIAVILGSRPADFIASLTVSISAPNIQMSLILSVISAMYDLRIGSVFSGCVAQSVLMLLHCLDIGLLRDGER